MVCGTRPQPGCVATTLPPGTTKDNTKQTYLHRKAKSSNRESRNWVEEIVVCTNHGRMELLLESKKKLRTFIFKNFAWLQKFSGTNFELHLQYNFFLNFLILLIDSIPINKRFLNFSLWVLQLKSIFGVLRVSMKYPRKEKKVIVCN